MKAGKTRKTNRRRNMYGGQATPPPYAAGVTREEILRKLRNFDQDALILKSYADEYKNVTTTLNDPAVMRTHLQGALNIATKGEDIYRRAQALWLHIYGTAWVPPPAAPAPAGA